MNGVMAGKHLIDDDDLETLCILNKEKKFTEEDIAELLDYAQKEEKHMFVLELLDYQNSVFGEKNGCRDLDLQDDPSGDDSTEECEAEEEE